MANYNKGKIANASQKDHKRLSRGMPRNTEGIANARRNAASAYPSGNRTARQRQARIDRPQEESIRIATLPITPRRGQTETSVSVQTQATHQYRGAPAKAAADQGPNYRKLNGSNAPGLVAAGVGVGVILPMGHEPHAPKLPSRKRRTP